MTLARSLDRTKLVFLVAWIASWGAPWLRVATWGESPTGGILVVAVLGTGAVAAIVGIALWLLVGLLAWIAATAFTAARGNGSAPLSIGR